MKRILSTALAIVLFIGAAQAQTTEEGKARHGKRGDMFKELNLTADQKARIQSIREAQKNEMKSLKADGRTEADKAKRKELHDKYKAQIESVLTAEQISKLKDHKKDGHEEGFGKGHKGDKKAKVKDFGKNLDLTADQQSKVRSINADFKARMETLRSNTTLSKEEKKAQFKQLVETHNTSLKAVLTQEQIAKMDARKKDLKHKRSKNL